MTTNITQFLKKFKANQQIALDASARVINESLLEMYRRMVQRTPVGNPALWKYPAHPDYTPGTLKAAWHISFNNKQRDTAGKFTSTSQLLGNYGLSFKVGVNTKQAAVIYNSTPYAQRVETGWSSQAPHGMMRITIQEFISVSDRFTVQYKVK